MKMSGRKESPNDGNAIAWILLFLFSVRLPFPFRNGQPESLLADRGTLHDGSFVAGVLTLLQGLIRPNEVATSEVGSSILFPEGGD